MPEEQQGQLSQQMPLASGEPVEPLAAAETRLALASWHPLVVDSSTWRLPAPSLPVLPAVVLYRIVNTTEAAHNPGYIVQDLLFSQCQAT